MKAVELKSITKRFGRTIANDGVDFDVDQGEIHAVLGENGAGKTTLMNVLSGVYQPDSGEIFVWGQRVRFRSPRDAISMGIRMIHQHFMLVQPLTVLDNIILGSRLRGWLNRKKLTESVSAVCQNLNFQIDLEKRVFQLSMGEQQKVEIVKALYQGARILIMDEPTSILTPQESEDLFNVLRRMKNEGHSIIFISHKLGEALSIADRITILRRGKVVDTQENKNLRAEQLAGLMLGHTAEHDRQGQTTFHRLNQIAKSDRSEVVLKMEGVVSKSDRHPASLDNVSLTIRSGEILGIAGVAGNGQLELAEAIVGLRRVESGSIFINGQDVTGKSVKEIIKMGVAYIPEDRIGVGSIQNLGICDNILLRCYDMFSFINSSEIKDYSKKLADRFHVVYSDLRLPVKHLSGGNLQKLILARELREIPKLLIAAYPTMGLDVRGSEYIREVLINCRNSGSAILLISEDLDELLAMSDRIAVMYEGKLTFMPTRDIYEIGLAMAGSSVAKE